MSGFPLRPALSQPDLRSHTPLMSRGTFSRHFLPGGFLESIPCPIRRPSGEASTESTLTVTPAPSPTNQCRPARLIGSSPRSRIPVATKPARPAKEKKQGKGKTTGKPTASVAATSASITPPASHLRTTAVPTAPKKGPTLPISKSASTSRNRPLVVRVCSPGASMPNTGEKVSTKAPMGPPASTNSKLSSQEEICDECQLPVTSESPICKRTRHQLAMKNTMKPTKRDVPPISDENNPSTSCVAISTSTPGTIATAVDQAPVCSKVSFDVCFNSSNSPSVAVPSTPGTLATIARASDNDLEPAEDTCTNKTNTGDAGTTSPAIKVPELGSPTSVARDHSPKELVFINLPDALSPIITPPPGFPPLDQVLATISSPLATAAALSPGSSPGLVINDSPYHEDQDASQLVLESPVSVHVETPVGGVTNETTPQPSQLADSYQLVHSPGASPIPDDHPVSNTSSPILNLNISEEALSELDNSEAQSAGPLNTNFNNPLDSDGSTCPGVTTRIGETVHFVLPIVSAPACTEDGCGTRFHNQNWSAAKRSVKRHLKEMHGLEVREVLWCIICERTLPTRLSKHGCFNYTPYYSIMHQQEQYKCTKPGCEFSCSTIAGIRNHKRSHRRKQYKLNRRAAASQNNSPDGSTTPTNTQRSIPPSAISPTSIDTSRTSVNPTQDSAVGGSQVQDEIEDAPDDDTPAAGNDFQVSDTAHIRPPDAPSPSLQFTRRFRDLYLRDNIDWSEFCDLLDEYITFAQEYVKLPPRREPSGVPPQPRVNDPRFIQRLYKHNRRRAMRLITEGTSSVRCDLAADVLASHFCPGISPVEDLNLFHHPKPAEDTPSTDPFMPEEVWAKLKSAENTSPGPDRLTYHHWKGADPEARTLAIIFSICLKIGRVPDVWKTSASVLIPKCDNPTVPSDWRPIAINSTISKLFTGCLAKRLSAWNELHSVLSPCQKGFVPYDGAFENTFVLNHRLQKARALHNELCVFSLDLSNAFGSVQHEALLVALSEVGVGDDFCKIIRDLYTGTTTSFLTDAGASAPTPILCGVRQGCPLSGMLFNIFIDPVLRNLQGDLADFKLLAFADDILLIADSPNELQDMIDHASQLISSIGLKINANKCFSFHLKHYPTGARNTSFYVDGIPAPTITDGEEKHFLGKPFGYNIFSDPSKIDDFSSTSEKILTSFLAPWQRIDGLKSFFYPSLNYAQRTAQHDKGEWKEIDTNIRPLVKKTLGLPPNASNNYLYGNRDDGLIGIPLCAEDSDIAHIDGAFKLLSSPDLRLKALAWADLTNTVAHRTGTEPAPSTLEAYLSGVDFDGSNANSNVWTRARSASQRLKVLWSIHDDQTATICLGETAITDRRKIFKTLRTCFKNTRSQDLGKQLHQGKTFHSFSKAKASSHFLSRGDYTRFADWRFIHQARLGCIKLNATPNNPNSQDPRCRRCGLQRETLPHVLCHCLPFMQKMTERHNRIVKRIKDSTNGRWQIISENQALAGHTVRPDLVLVRDNSALILDVTCPFENGANAFSIARREKEKKYADLAKTLRGRYKDVSVEAIVVGALGSWDPRNDKPLLRLCSKKYLHLMRRLIVSDTIRASQDIFMSFITGRPTNQQGYHQRNQSSAPTEDLPPSTQASNPHPPPSARPENATSFSEALHSLRVTFAPSPNAEHEEIPSTPNQFREAINYEFEIARRAVFEESSSSANASPPRRNCIYDSQPVSSSEYVRNFLSDSGSASDHSVPQDLNINVSLPNSTQERVSLPVSHDRVSLLVSKDRVSQPSAQLSDFGFSTGPRAPQVPKGCASQQVSTNCVSQPVSTNTSTNYASRPVQANVITNYFSRPVLNMSDSGSASGLRAPPVPSASPVECSYAAAVKNALRSPRLCSNGDLSVLREFAPNAVVSPPGSPKRNILPFASGATNLPAPFSGRTVSITNNSVTLQVTVGEPPALNEVAAAGTSTNPLPSSSQVIGDPSHTLNGEGEGGRASCSPPR